MLKQKKEAEEKARLAAAEEEQAKQKADAKAKQEAEEKAKELAKTKAFEAKIKEIIDLGLINFKLNQNALTQQSNNTIKDIALILKKISKY